MRASRERWRYDDLMSTSTSPPKTTTVWDAVKESFSGITEPDEQQRAHFVAMLVAGYVTDGNADRELRDRRADKIVAALDAACDDGWNGDVAHPKAPWAGIRWEA